MNARAHTARASRLLVYTAIVALALAGPGAFWHSGVIDREATFFVTHYSADRPVLRTVFDPHANDLGTYQARELSYFIDFIDAAVFRLVVRSFDRPLFVPLSAIASSFLFVIIFLVGTRRTTTHVDWLSAALVTACFLASFGFMSTMGVFYRSGKPVLAVVVLAFLFHVRGVSLKRSDTARREPADRRDAAVAFVLLLIAGLLDRQGFFYVLGAAAILFLHVKLTGRLRHVWAASIAAAIGLTLYNVVIAPIVIATLNGYWPDFSYQSLPLPELLRPQVHVSRAIRLLLMNLAMVLGGFAGVAVVVTATALVLAWRRFGLPCGLTRADVARYLLRDPHGRVVTYGALVFLLHVVMFALMVARHSPIFLYVDHRYWYYPLPFLATVLFGVLLLVNAAMARLSPRERLVIPMILFVVAVSNVFSLGWYRDTMTTGPYFGSVFQQSEMLKASIIRGVAHPDLEPQFRLLFDFDRRLRANQTR